MDNRDVVNILQEIKQDIVDMGPERDAVIALKSSVLDIIDNKIDELLLSPNDLKKRGAFGYYSGWKEEE